MEKMNEDYLTDFWETGPRRRAPQRRQGSPWTPAPGEFNLAPQPRDRNLLATLQWLAVMVVITTTPALFVYGTVNPLLADTVPFVVTHVPITWDITVYVQVFIIILLLVRSWEFFSIQVDLTRHTQRGLLNPLDTKWCRRCCSDVPSTASHCRRCDKCISNRSFHSLILNGCLSESGPLRTRYKTLMRHWLVDSLMLLSIYLLEATQGGPVETSKIVLCIFWAFGASLSM